MRLAPDILPPAFYPVSLNLVGRRCIVIGAADDPEALAKADDLREVGAAVECIAPEALRDDDLRGAFFVISTPNDAVLSARLRVLAEREHVLLCTIDQPAYGFVALQAQVKAGRARIGISTGGVSPSVGASVRRALADALDATFARFLECLAQQRRLTRARFADDGEARRAALRAAAAGFRIDVRVAYPQWFVDELEGLRPTLIDQR